MKKRLSLWKTAFAIIFSLAVVIIPQKIAHAAIEDGTYEINYEVKEADNDNTSIADGYFSKPAILIVEDGDQHIQLTVTSSNMIKSLSAPTGEVDIIDEDEEEETRTVRFMVDDDLSEPVEMEMHIVVPDLYDTTHTARAVFDVDELEEIDGDQVKEKNEDLNEEEDNDSSDEELNNEKSDENEIDENNDEADDVLTENANENEEISEADNDNTSNALWITLVVVGVLFIAGILFWIFRKKRKK